ncbi:hypothetical protein HMPREF9248_0315 [Fannyhessea vaginae PB189-T1-4]|uniref:Uncharacterized protein n=1 Tax=Fannyhessea vaginae PB189-T1-4 TaxID=866774 RepID=A0ABP2IYG7_9ACTN|nr:hypothetical protein HMPREF9248_0315 [Fannyhessea vaginae PB189-T1-4]
MQVPCGTCIFLPLFTPPKKVQKRISRMGQKFKITSSKVQLRGPIKEFN